jgi:hypothetical protein
MMAIVAKEEGQVNYEFSDRLKRRAHIRAMLLRAKKEFLNDKDERVSARPTSD